MAVLRVDTEDYQSFLTERTLRVLRAEPVA